MKQNYTPENNKKQKIWAGWLFVALLSALLLSNFAGDTFKKMFVNLLLVLTPILIGLFLAFILKRFLTILETKVFAHWFEKTKNPFKSRRIFCLILIFTLLVLLILAVLWLVIPNLINFITEFSQNAESFVNSVSSQLNSFFGNISWLDGVDIQQTINDALASVLTWVSNSIPVITTTVLSFLSKTALYLGFILIGFIIAFLYLKDKEKINSFARRFTYAYCKPAKAEKIISITRKSDMILFDYFIGKLIEALVIFLVMLPGFYAFKIPYPIGLASTLAILNIIPYVGSIVAMIPITLFAIFFRDVSTALWLLLYLNVMLILVGNFISPVIFGKKLKVSSLLMICSFLIGGGLFGILGMLFAPPVAAIIWVFVNEMLIAKEQSKLKTGNFNESLPLKQNEEKTTDKK